MSTQTVTAPRPWIPQALTGLVGSRRRMIVAAIALLLVVAIVSAFVITRSQTASQLVTTPVVRQNLVQSVTASGTVNPQNTVLVGTQVSGTISEIDVDYNSKVHQGEVLARIDPSTLQAQLQQAQAALAQAQAQADAARANATGAQSSAAGAQESIAVAQANHAAALASARSAQAAIATADADVAKAQSALNLAQLTVNRDNTLLAQGYIAQAQADTDQSSLAAALSGLRSAQAAATQARAQAVASTAQAQSSGAQTLVQSNQSAQSAQQAIGSGATAEAADAAVQGAQAQVQQDQLNIERSVITSPVNGTVIARNISVGQTVAASLQTPTLFSIAQDQSKMEVDIAVGESDIGSVRPKENVDFTVLAYPNRTFHGTVVQVRENPITTNNVVTYTVITNVDNRDGALLPGMTATASVQIAQASNALVVPLQALQYRPQGQGQTTHRRSNGSAGAGAGAQRQGAPSATSPWGRAGSGASSIATGQNGMLFVERNGAPQRVRVRIDLVSGTQAAVTPVNGTLSEGDTVILSDGSPRSAQRSATNSVLPTTGGRPLGRGF